MVRTIIYKTNDIVRNYWLHFMFRLLIKKKYDGKKMIIGGVYVTSKDKIVSTPFQRSNRMK